MVDEYKSYKANCRPHQFVPSQCLMVKKLARKNQCRCQKCTMNNRCRTHLPSGFIGVYPTGFQIYEDNAKSKWGPIQLAVLLH